MKKIFLPILLMVVFLLSACSSAPATSITGPAQNPTAVAVSSPTATDATGAQTSSKVDVQITEGDNWIKSSQTTFKVGVTYVFTVTNTGHRAHSFSISHPAEKTNAGVSAAKSGAFVFISEQQLIPGAVMTAEYTFTEPAPAGTLEFACLIPMHYKMGQVLAIVVEQ